MKMYILIHEKVPAKLSPVVAAHASLSCYLKFKEDEQMQLWVNSVFKKVVCKISETEFENAKTVNKCLIMTESALNNEEVAIVYCPREEYPKNFKFFKMWTP